MELIKTTNERIEEALSRKGTLCGTGKNKFMTWNVSDDNNCVLYRIYISQRSGQITIEKFLNNDDFIKHGRTTTYKAQYDPEKESFKIEMTEHILSDERDGTSIENKYFLFKDRSFLTKKYNDILVEESLIDGWKHFSYTDYDLKTMQENTSFSCNLNPNNEFVNGKYSSKVGKSIFLFNHGICNSPTSHIYVGGKKIQKNWQMFKNLNQFVDILKFQAATGNVYVDLFIGYLVEEIAEAVKKNPEGYEGVIDNPQVKEKLLLEFDEQLRVKLKTLALEIPFCDLYKMINNALSRDKEKVLQKK